MRVLVTGSSGTIGTRLCEVLLSAGQSVIGIDRVPNKWQRAVQAVTQIVDLLHPEEMQTLPCDVDAIVHLAANARVYELVEDPARALENVQTLFHTLEWARRNGIKRFLFASSRECYGNLHNSQEQAFSPAAYAEDMVRIEHCESPYTASKLGGEALVHAYTRCYGFDHIIFRFSNVYGMYDDSERVVPLFIRRAGHNEPLTIFGKDKCLDFTYIDDAVGGIIAAIDKFDGAKNNTYNIAYGQGTTIVQLADDVKRLLQSRSDVILGSPRTGEVIRYIADICKAREKLGYIPKTPFSEGIKKAVEWYAAREA